MKIRIIILVFLTAWCAETNAQQNITTFILIRHAEKGNDGTTDPDLTDQGRERAANLVKLLKETQLDAVYSTDYKRTRNTVLPVSASKGLTVQGYEPLKTEEVDAMLKRFNGGTVLICGHSNTIPWIVNYLTGKDQYKNFEDNDYNNLIVVSVVERGKTTKVTWMRY